MRSEISDVVIVGGGPAGLSAALLLGRSLRNVVVCDEGRPRNERSPSLHGYLGSDGADPREFLNRSRAQLKKYDSVSWVKTRVSDITRDSTHFVTSDGTGKVWRSKAVLLATGLVDRLPDIPGAEEYFGISLHQCPYCDGWENRGRVLGVTGSDEAAIELALELRQWSERVILFTGCGENAAINARLGESRVAIIPGKITGLRSLENRPGQLAGILLDNGAHISCNALFFSPSQAQHSPLARRLGCDMEGPAVGCDEGGQTNVPGLFVAGNATSGVQMVQVAAAGGLLAGVTINNWLTDYDASYLAPMPRDQALADPGSRSPFDIRNEAQSSENVRSLGNES